MIVVLSRDPSLQSLWQRFWKKSVIKEVNILGESVMLLHIGQKTDWTKFAQRLGRYAGRVVAGESIPLPEERPWKRLDVRKVEEKLLCDTLCRMEEGQDWVGVYDPEGELKTMVWELAQHFPRLSVWCREREKYDILCEDLLEQYGAAIERSSHWEGLKDCPIIGSMTTPDFRLCWQGLFLLPGKAEIPLIDGRSGSLCQQLQLPIPKEVEENCPCDLSPQSLYLALLKEGKVPWPEGLSYLIPVDCHKEKLEFRPFEKNM